MRIHRILAVACVDLLAEVFDEGLVLDRVMARAFKAHPKWGKRDRNFVAESVWEVVRWRRSLEFVAGAADFPALLAALWRRKGLTVPDWWHWEGETLDEMTEREEVLPQQSRAVRESIPDWLDQLGEHELGERWASELAALNQRAPVFLRVNTLLNTKSEAMTWLADEGVEVHEVDGVENGLVLAEGKLLPKPLVRDGRVEIQDAGSQMITPLLEVQPGMKVVDACAGAGGKTLQLAAAMEGQGEILALDVVEGKLMELKRRAGRAGVRNVRAEVWNRDSLTSRLGWADRVLVDAPCSGLGTLRRQPDLKWRLNEEILNELKERQSRLIENCLEFLKPEGKLVYATCSLLGSENDDQVAALVKRDPRWAVEEACRISPQATGWDGFYGARIARS